MNQHIGRVRPDLGENGVSLIEVMFAMVILAFGVLMPGPFAQCLLRPAVHFRPAGASRDMGSQEWETPHQVPG